MIITRLIGGLGNQMFQYAAGKALACRHGVEVKVDLSELNKQAGEQYTQRHYELGIFDSGIQVATENELRDFTGGDRSRLRREVQRRLPFLFNSLCAVESGAAYHPQFESYPRHTMLQGFWQSERYFRDYEQEIRNDFRFRSSVLEATRSLRETIASCEAVSLHVRRGDYVSNPSANQFHGLCSPRYYEQAVRHLAALHPDIRLFVFSDDIAWCRENLSFSQSVQFMETGSPYEDLYLMSQCRHNIIANSSFSWWGAWLNAHAGKIVVAPQQWFQDPSVNTSDIIPASWIRL